ncbi:unnamed protein product [Gordionus sp. m RMFG-2023]
MKKDFFTAEVGILSNCDGSCIINTPEITLLCGVQSPSKLSESKESCEEAKLEFFYNPLYNDPQISSQNSEYNKLDDEDDFLKPIDNIVIDESKIELNLLNMSNSHLRYKLYPRLNKCQELFLLSVCRNAIYLDNYPNTLISISIQELQQSLSSTTHNLLSTCINASCLALMDSGIALKYMFNSLPIHTSLPLNKNLEENLIKSHKINSICTLVFNQFSPKFISCYCKFGKKLNIDELSFLRKALEFHDIREIQSIFELYKNVLIAKHNKIFG